MPQILGLQHVWYVSNIALKRQLVSNKCTQNSSKFLPNPWSQNGFLMVSYTFRGRAIVGPWGPPRTAKSTTDPSLRHRSAPSTQVQRLRGSLGLRIGPWRSDRFGKYQKMGKKKKWPDWSCFKCLILCWCLPFRVVSSNCWRSNLVQPKRPKTVQSPEWSGLTVLHPT